MLWKVTRLMNHGRRGYMAHISRKRGFGAGRCPGTRKMRLAPTVLNLTVIRKSTGVNRARTAQCGV
jgi:hypothetical protein